HRQSLHNAPKCADKGGGEGDVTVQHRHRAEPRIDLNELDFQTFVFEKALSLSDVVRGVGVAAAGERDADLLRLRAGALLEAKNPEERNEHYRNAPARRHPLHSLFPDPLKIVGTAATVKNRAAS